MHVIYALPLYIIIPRSTRHAGTITLHCTIPYCTVGHGGFPSHIPPSDRQTHNHRPSCAVPPAAGDRRAEEPSVGRPQHVRRGFRVSKKNWRRWFSLGRRGKERDRERERKRGNRRDRRKGLGSAERNRRRGKERE